MKYDIAHMLGRQKELAHLQSDSSSFGEFLKNLPTHIYIEIMNEWAEENVDNPFILIMVHSCATCFDIPESIDKEHLISFIVGNAQLLFLSKLKLIDNYSAKERGFDIEGISVIKSEDLQAALDKMQKEYVRLNEPGMPWITKEAEKDLIKFYESLVSEIIKQEGN